MKPLLSSLSLKSRLLALGLAAGMCVPVSAGAMPQVSPAVPAGVAMPDIVQARMERNNDAAVIWRRPGGASHWRGNREWHGSGNWRGNREWHDSGSWHGNRHWNGGRWHRERPRYRRHGDGWGWGASGLMLGLGLGLPYGYYGPGYYYGPDYYAPPRRVYRVYKGSNAHVRWCYARYRSYRASDNTFQPYHGPRKQCRSPY